MPEAQGADYIKIDVQGGELEIFKNGTKTLQTVSFIHTEVSFIELYEGQPLFADVDQFLRSLGFRFIKMLGIGTRNLKPLSWGDNSGGHHWLWTDALYARDVSCVATMTSEAIEKMAIVAHDLYELHDLATLLLQHLDQRDQTLKAQDYFQRLVAEGHE
ncbi:MAG: FkbM family methyltransferase [Gammaproteobacteria bacterium]|nr:FkbM family methyltransferase [Gammaproteobacteria bacterium]